MQRVALLLLLFLLVPGFVPGQSPVAPEPDWNEQLLKSAGIDISTESLLDFFRKRTPTPADQEQTEYLITKLSSEVYTEREIAKKSLLARGSLSLPLLTKATKKAD